MDKTADYEQMLGELYYTLQHYYYDETHHKTDWKAVYEEHRPVLQQVREDQDFADYANEMIGRLNSSHMGFSMPRTGRIDEPSAHVGAVWAFAGGKPAVGRLIKDGPLYDRRETPSRPATSSSPSTARPSTRRRTSGRISTASSKSG